jgi:hypothetical protein
VTVFKALNVISRELQHASGIVNFTTYLHFSLDFGLFGA